MDEMKQLAFLLLMKPGTWYCSSGYAGCEQMPTNDGGRFSGRILTSLRANGFIESMPVFDGFLTMKHRITPAGIEWLVSQPS